MGNPGKPPKSHQEALAQGLAPVPNVRSFVKSRLGLTQAEFRRQKAQFAAANGPVDCTTAPDGTTCFDWTYPDGTHVVGICTNNSCKTYSTP
jgi:hypothetical protein